MLREEKLRYSTVDKMEVKRIKRKKQSGMMKLSKLVNSLSTANSRLKHIILENEQKTIKLQEQVKSQNELILSIEEEK